MVYSVKVLKDGYSYEKDGQYKANGTCTLIFGPDSKELGMYLLYRHKNHKYNHLHQDKGRRG